MARQRKELKSAKDIKLKHPDRSAPTKETLVNFASDRNLFEQADARQRELDKIKRRKLRGGNSDSDSESDSDDEDDEAELTPGAERFLDTLLWTATLGTINFTFEVLVQNQYGMDLEWDHIIGRTARAWILFLFIFYPLHPTPANPRLVPFVPLKYQHWIRQFIFFVMSVSAGPYLIHISNEYGYLNVMKRAPPLGCLWLWSIVELDLVWGVISLAMVIVFAYVKGYAFS